MKTVDFLLVLLQVLFIYLKLIGQIDWSWWLVFSPSLIYVTSVFLIIFAAIIYIGRGQRRFK